MYNYTSLNSTICNLEFVICNFYFMGLPAKQRTRTSKRQRASHFALKTPPTTKCGQCGAFNKPHRACAKCGFYRGRRVIDVAKRTARLARSRKGSGKAGR